MPNHITTDVEIRGTKENIEALVKATGLKRDNDTEANQFDFNGIIKMPKELVNTTSPANICETQEEADAKNAEEEKKPYRTYYLSKEQSDKLIEKYGTNNWYDWSCNNWGTKWNSYEVRYLEGDEDKIVISIQTAWDTPRGIWRALEEQGFEVRGMIYGEMEGYEALGDGYDVFDAYVQVDYVG